MFLFKGVLFNVYKKNDFKDKETGEVKEGKTTLQVINEYHLQNGSIKKDILEVSIDPKLVSNFEDKVGKNIEIPIKFTTFKDSSIVFLSYSD